MRWPPVLRRQRSYRHPGTHPGWRCLVVAVARTEASSLPSWACQKEGDLQEVNLVRYARQDDIRPLGKFAADPPSAPLISAKAMGASREDESTMSAHGPLIPRAADGMVRCRDPSVRARSRSVDNS